MNWQNIKVSADSTHFLLEEKQIFDKHFLEVLKFHAPGLAPVKDQSGAYHITVDGNSLYKDRYNRTFGFYCNRATVTSESRWFHITENGEKAYKNHYAWCGNYQDNLCTVRDANNQYFHIDLNGHKVYAETFTYAGDYKDGIACVKTANGFYKHINAKGESLNKIEFLDLGIFHKNFATAKDIKGWHHIDMLGRELYQERYTAIEPFYNGFALVTQYDNQKIIIDEKGNHFLTIG
jgi:hypothetical protein